MNEDEIKDMVEYCKYSDGCFDCPYNPEDNRSMYALRWYGGCPDCDKELVRAMGKGYRKVADDEIVVKRSELGKVVISHERADLMDMLNQETRELQRANAIKQETAREILQALKDNIIEVDFGCGAGVYEVVDMDTDELKQLAKAYGIELE